MMGIYNVAIGLPKIYCPRCRLKFPKHSEWQSYDAPIYKYPSYEKYPFYKLKSFHNNCATCRLFVRFSRRGKGRTLDAYRMDFPCDDFSV